MLINRFFAWFQRQFLKIALSSLLLFCGISAHSENISTFEFLGLYQPPVEKRGYWCRDGQLEHYPVENKNRFLEEKKHFFTSHNNEWPEVHLLSPDLEGGEEEKYQYHRVARSIIPLERPMSGYWI